MTRKLVRVALLCGTILSTISASPASVADGLKKRWEEGVDCTNSEVGAPAGLLYAYGLSLNNYNCDEIDQAKSANGDKCLVTDGSNGGRDVACPSDPAPTQNPDGSPAQSVPEGIVSAWCQINPGGGLAWSFVNTVGCLLFSYYEAHGDPIAEATSGAFGICDAIFAGACTFFVNIAPELQAGMDRPCVDDPGSHACDFANPGK